MASIQPELVKDLLDKNKSIPTDQMLYIRDYRLDLPFRIRAGVFNKWRRQVAREAANELRKRLQAA